MKIKLDENLPNNLAAALSAMGHDVDSTITEGLSGSEDSKIWQAAQKVARFLITQDLDFSDVRKFTPGTHHGILLIRLRDPSRENLNQRVIELFRSENITAWSGCFVVATEQKVRVRRPRA